VERIITTQGRLRSACSGAMGAAPAPEGPSLS
jgi:hypothetical protein